MSAAISIKSHIREYPSVGTRDAVHRHLVPMTVAILGIVSVAMLIVIHQISEREHAYFLLANAVMDIQEDSAKAYMNLEEALREGGPAEVEKAWSVLDRTITHCEAILRSGVAERGLSDKPVKLCTACARAQGFQVTEQPVVIQPLNEPELQAQAEDMLQGLTEFKVISEQRYHNQEQERSRSHLDKRSDEIFARLLTGADAMESTLLKHKIIGQAKKRRLVSGILLVWSCILAGATTDLWSRDRRRRIAERSLLEANAHLESQTEELRRHREHLEDLVEERTRDLRTAYSELEQEVTDRELAEEALRKSEEQYRTLVEAMNEGLTITDADGILIFVNDRFCKMLGYSRNELLGHPRTEFVAEGDRQILTEELQRILRQDHSPSEVTFQRKDGQRVFTMVSPGGLFDKDGVLVRSFAVVTDITEKIALQTKSMRAGHLASLGELAAGVAHEINNPINGIINYAQLLCKEHKSQGHDLGNRIIKEGRRIAEIVRGLLLFARGGNREKIPVRVSEIVSDALGLTGSQMRKEGIEVLSTIPVDLPEIIADPQEIQQVFMNVISNARYALNQNYPGRHEGKRLQIRAERLVGDACGWVRVTFHDRGMGIPAGIMDKIREPFFSTKPRGKGTGLGLSISEGIVSEHGGKLSIESVEGEWTSVVIDLPAGGV